MEAIRARKEFCILGGDLNKLVGRAPLGVPGNHPDTTLGGRLLLDLLATGNWVLVNGLGHKVVKGGPFTRKDPASGNMSCLDMFVVSTDLLPYVQSLVIDSQQELAMTRAVRVGSNYQLVPSDHFTCILTLTNLPRVQERKGGKQVAWNLAKEGGWNKYNILSDKYSDDLKKVVGDDHTNIEEKMTKFEKIHEKIKFKAFGKVTINGNKKEMNRKKIINSDNDDEAHELFEEQEKKAEHEIEEIKKMKLPKLGNVWEIRKRVMGGGKNIEATAIIDPVTGKLVVSKHRIKQVSLAYCKATLANNQPDKEFREEILSKLIKVQTKLSDNKEEFHINKETFDFIIKKFRRSNKKNYDFLVKSGKGFQAAVFKFCQVMFKEEDFPKQFSETTLHMIYKGGKGRREKLENNRFIHSKSWFPRTAEACLVEEGMKQALVDGSSMYQIGGHPGHRAEELIFVLKSIIAKYVGAGKQIIIQSSDLSKFFDKEMIEDAILTS